MDLAWDKSKYGYSRMLEAIHECMEGKKKAGALLQVIEDGTGEFFDKAADVKYTKTSFYLELDIHFDKEKELYIGTRTGIVRVT